MNAKLILAAAIVFFSMTGHAEMQVAFQDPSIWNGTLFPASQLCREKGGSREAGMPSMSIQNIPDEAEMLSISVHNQNPRAQHNQGGVSVELSQAKAQKQLTVVSIPGTSKGRESFKYPEGISPTENSFGKNGYSAPCPEGSNSNYVLKVEALKGGKVFESAVFPLGRP